MANKKEFEQMGDKELAMAFAGIGGVIDPNYSPTREELIEALKGGNKFLGGGYDYDDGNIY